MTVCPDIETIDRRIVEKIQSLKDDSKLHGWSLHRACVAHGLIEALWVVRGYEDVPEEVGVPSPLDFEGDASRRLQV